MPGPPEIECQPAEFVNSVGQGRKTIRRFHLAVSYSFNRRATNWFGTEKGTSTFSGQRIIDASFSRQRVFAEIVRLPQS
jgi:hypothetical protein